MHYTVLLFIKIIFIFPKKCNLNMIEKSKFNFGEIVTIVSDYNLSIKVFPHF